MNALLVSLNELLFFIVFSGLYTQVLGTWPSGGPTVLPVFRKYRDRMSPRCAAALTEVFLSFVSFSKHMSGVYLGIDKCFLPNILEYTTR